MSNSPPATTLFLHLFEESRRHQEVLNDLFIGHWAMLSALTERDEGFYDVYLAHEEVNKVGEMGQKLASTLQGMDELIAHMKKASQ